MKGEGGAQPSGVAQPLYTNIKREQILSVQAGGDCHERACRKGKQCSFWGEHRNQRDAVSGVKACTTITGSDEAAGMGKDVYFWGEGPYCHHRQNGAGRNVERMQQQELACLR
eukprot:1161640-Pelagomonas_calceolata.AAC.7